MKPSGFVSTLLYKSRDARPTPVVWQGVAVARFTLHLKDGTLTLELTTNEVMPNITTDTTINGYAITLKNLSPFPGESNDAEPVAVLLIEHR